MPAVAIRSTALTSTNIKWVKPEPLWASPDSEMTKPFVAEFDKDSFVPDFLAMMAGSTPIDLKKPQDKVPKKPEDANKPDVLKLYQPLHRRYYLVTGSLVCRQFGLPDRTVVPKNREKTSFVLRRFINGTEYGWVNDESNKGWKPLVDDQNRPVLIRKDEQRLPTHPVKTCTSTQPSGTLNVAGQTTCEQRKVYYGYIPVDGREKYLSAAAETDILGAVSSPVDFHLGEVDGRVISVWRGLYNNPSDDDQKNILSLYLILDLGDFLQGVLSDVFNALGTNGQSLSDEPKRKALFDELSSLYLPASSEQSGEITLAGALDKLRDKLSLVQGQGDEPTDQYKMYLAYKKDNSNPPKHIPIVPATYLKSDDTGTLYKLFHDALIEGGAPVHIPDDLKGMIKDEPLLGDVYCLRLVYEYGDGCVVLSDLSEPFTFAKVFDPDAPARPVRIELPSIKLQDLRKFKKGVGMQSSCELNALTNMLSLDAINNNKIKLPGPCPVDIGMICSFSIQIITLVAFIVMFIFLIALNIVFWWLAFIKICFPVPKPK